MLCKEKYISYFSWNEILKVLIKDLKILETDGISIDSPTKVTFKGSLVAVLGDNLGSHQIGGFTESFGNTKHFCRYCEIDRENFETNPLDRKPLRTIESYEKNVLEAKKSRKIVNGVKTNSPLNELKYFHVCDPGLPPCAAHDLFEGIVAFDLWLAIEYFVKQKWFKPYLLNYRVNNVSITDEKYDFIPNVNIKNKLKKLTGSAIQIRRLLMVLPIAIADLIKDFDDNVWEMVLELRKLCDIVCAPKISNSQRSILKSTIENYILLRLNCFPKVKIRPKHEFALHYAEMIEIFGPLKHLWTLRFESKHKYFKSVVKRTQNFKNVTQTLAAKHELMQCSIEDQYSSAIIIDENDMKTPAQHCNAAANSAISKYFYNKENTVKYLTSKVTYHGIVYNKGMTICTGKNEYGNFIVINIEFILIEQNYSDIYFIGKSQEIIYCCELGVYEFANYKESVSDQNYSVFSITDLLSPDPLLRSSIKSVPILIAKYALYDPED